MNFKSKNMSLILKNNIGYLTFKDLEKYKFIKHAFSTRLGGVSKNEFKSMNFGFNRGDSKENVLENYKRFCDVLNIKLDNLVASCQDHGTFIRKVTSKEKGFGILKPNNMKSVDGLVTNELNVALVTYYADCTPLYFLDPIKKVVGLAHAGWRGTVKKIGSNMIKKMKDEFNCNPSDIICAIGPAIQKSCYEVNKDVYQKILEISPESTEILSDNKFLVDLKNTNKKILMESGIREKNIIISDVCTKCNSDLLFSHRQMNIKRGTMIAIIELKKE